MFSFRIWMLIAIAYAVRWLRPIVRIRFGTLFVSRLGHLAGNTECYLCERDAGINHAPRTIDIWTPLGKPANEQLLKMYARVLPMWRGGVGVIAAGKHLPGWTQAHTFSDEQWGRDIHNLMEKFPAHIRFTKAEERRGQETMRRMGLDPEKPWVCVINRDPMYLRVTEPAEDYSYHSFRDSNIDNYRDAAIALIERGYQVIRMGRHVEAQMKLSGGGFYDYAISEFRSDFMDVYLGAKCAFTISNGTGFDAIPMVFRRPICFVNEAPFEYLSTWMKDSLAIWKHHYRDGRLMQPCEIVASGAGLFHTSQQYTAAGITLVENTPEEIRDAALEMAHTKTWGDECGEQAQSYQDAFWKNYPRSKSPHTGQPLHGAVRLRIGSKFLEKYAL